MGSCQTLDTAHRLILTRPPSQGLPPAPNCCTPSLTKATWPPTYTHHINEQVSVTSIGSWKPVVDSANKATSFERLPKEHISAVLRPYRVSEPATHRLLRREKRARRRRGATPRRRKKGLAHPAAPEFPCLSQRLAPRCATLQDESDDDMQVQIPREGWASNVRGSGCTKGPALGNRCGWQTHGNGEVRKSVLGGPLAPIYCARNNTVYLVIRDWTSTGICRLPKGRGNMQPDGYHRLRRGRGLPGFDWPIGYLRGIIGG